MKEVKNSNMIEIQEEIQIGDVILERGDRIEVLKEKTVGYNEVEEALVNFFSLNNDVYTLGFVDDLRYAIISAFQYAYDTDDIEGEENKFYDAFLSKMFREYR